MSKFWRLLVSLVADSRLSGEEMAGGIMRYVHLALAALCILTSLGGQHGEASQTAASSLEDELRRVDLDQSRFAQAADGAAMSALLHPAFTTHLPNGSVVARSQVLALFVESGASARERFQRTHERVLVAGTTGIVIGVDCLEAPPPFARNGERTRRYTNVYIRENGRWLMLARHVHLLP